jgi:transposase
MFLPSDNTKVFLALGATDMRKSINGLSILVQENMNLDPFSGHLFVFCNRKRQILKILYWDRNGFCLFHKRLEKHRFKWPRSEKEVINIGQRQLLWLMEGLEIHQKTAHDKLSFSELF